MPGSDGFFAQTLSMTIKVVQQARQEGGRTIQLSGLFAEHLQRRHLGAQALNRRQVRPDRLISFADGDRLFSFEERPEELYGLVKGSHLQIVLSATETLRACRKTQSNSIRMTSIKPI
jgi:hypothetical protein